MKVSIVIPNWNGKKLLEKNLPAVLAAGADEVIVSDDDSADDSVEFLKDNFPQVKVIKHKRLGFAGNCNQGVKFTKGEVVILLNTDVVPEKDFIKPLEKDFSDPNVFAVSLGEPQWSWAKGEWVKGFVEHKPGEKTKVPHISFWASGGSGAFRKDIWNKLGGFDEIYNPFYWEDLDLSYRAWKRGYKVIWDPRSVVYHEHAQTISLFSKDYVRSISERNQLLFIWKNITSLNMMFEHKLNLTKRLLTNLGYWRPFLTALVKLLPILSRRFKEMREQRISDREIFAQFN